MDVHAALLSRRRGFSLVELLVALSLVAVVMTLAWLMLESARRTAAEVALEPDGATVEFWRGLKTDLDHLVDEPSHLEDPTLSFAPGKGLDMKALTTTEAGVPVETRVAYRLRDEALLRIHQQAFSDLAVTNRVVEGILAFAVEGRLAEAWTPEWPVEGASEKVPSRLRIVLDTGREAPEMREWFLPLSLRAEPPPETP